jgi:anaerobic magnesium-protoporphyrin IX monomethyl ester cyclase
VTRTQRAVLVGPIQQENLALQYLAASARAAGHQASVVAYSYRRDLDAAVRITLQKDPTLVGLGIAFQNNIDDYLLFLQELRARGFSGHLTCGGHVPTFCHDELLRDVPGLDTVVRHDGEETLVEMLDCLARGEPPRNIAGLVWRENEQIVKGPVRRAAAGLDHLPWPERSAGAYLVGGITVDFLITARGCVGECNYCSIAAYTSEQSRPFRLRRPDAVAAEIARQYHERGARVMFVQDDLFVLPSEKKCVERVDAIADALKREGVSDIVFWVKGRPETITDGVCQALRRLGTIHMFLGVESASAQRLDYLGRTHLPIHNQTAIERCRRHDIVPSFNFMLFDPDCTLEDVAATLDMADQHLDLPWNVCRTEVYSGTALRSRLESEGRLEGDYRSYGYLMRDERAEVMFRILRVSLHERALEIESLLNRLISLSFSRQLHQHFFPGEASDALGRSIIDLGVAVRRDTVRELRRTLEFVRTSDVRDELEVRRFAVEQAFAINARDQAWRKQSEELWEHLNLRGAHLMERRGVERRARGQSGWGVAAGS